MPDDVKRDRRGTMADVFQFIATASSPPPVVNQTSGLPQTPFPVGIEANGAYVRYNTNATASGSQDFVPFYIPKPHRLMRIEVILLNGTSEDAFTGAVSVQKYYGDNGTQGYATDAAYNELQTTASSTPDGNLVFLFGLGYEEKDSIYAVSFTATAGRKAFIKSTIEYI